MVSEARTGKRFPMELPIKIHLTDTNQDVTGTTSNMSAAGVYIHADGALTVGSSVEFQITLPAEVTGSATPVVLQCKGRVVRADGAAKAANAAQQGVACVIDSYELVRNS